MADTGKTILMLGVVGVGAYFLYEWWLSQTTATTTTSATPGTTPTMNQAQLPTSVSTVATSTPSTTAAATTPTVQQPTATDLQNQIKMTLANADQWNYAYRQLMGYGIDQVFGFNFDAVYGSVQSDGTRSSGQLSAQAFLNAPTLAGFTTAKTVQGVSGLGRLGLGRIATFHTPVVNPLGSMIYRAQHPSPYRNPSINMSGFTQPTGFETALWAGQSLRSNRIL